MYIRAEKNTGQKKKKNQWIINQPITTKNQWVKNQAQKKGQNQWTKNQSESHWAETNRLLTICFFQPAIYEEIRETRVYISPGFLNVPRSSMREKQTKINTRAGCTIPLFLPQRFFDYFRR